MIFVPVFIGYDRVPEEAAYLKELEGGKKDPESLSQVIKARKALKRRYGRIYIRFHDGISINDLQEEVGKTMAEMTSKEFNGFCRDLGYSLVNAIDKAAVITPHAVIAAAILNEGKQKFSRSQITENVQTYINYLNFRKASLADTLLVEQERAFDYVMDMYEQRKFIEKIEPEAGESGQEEHYIINSTKRPALEYYSNNCAKAFIPGAFTAMAIIAGDAFQFSSSDLHESYAFMRSIFKHEFAYDLDRPPEFFVQKSIKAFIDEAILMPHPTIPDRYDLTASGFRKLKLFAAFLGSYFESYWIVLNFFMRYPHDFADPKDRVKKIQSMGNRMFKKKEIQYPEALSKVNYKNAIDFFIHKGVRGSEDEEKIRYYKETLRHYLDKLQS